MTEQDWITVYQQSLPVIEGHQGSAITTSLTVTALCIFISLFLFGLMKKKKMEMNVRNLLIIFSPIIISLSLLGSSFWKHFKDPYAMTGVVEKKWVSGRYDIPMIAFKSSSANFLTAEGKGAELPEKIGYMNLMATNEIYEHLEENEEILVLSMGNDQVFGRLKGEKLLVPMPPKRKE